MAGQDILQALWYSTSTLQVFGANPILWRKKNPAYQISYLSIIYILIIISVLAASLWNSGEGRNSLHSENEILLVVAHSKIRLVLGPVCSIFMLLSSITSAPTACQAISGLSQFSTNFPQHFSNLHYRSIVGGSLIVMSLLFISYFYTVFLELTTVNMVSQDLLESWDYLVFCICWMSFDVISSAALTHMFILIFTLFTQFRSLEGELKTSLKKLSYWRPASQLVHVLPKQSSAFQSPMDISRYRRIYINLTCVADDINHAFAVRLLILISFNTVLLFFSSFMILLNIAHVSHTMPMHITCPWLVGRIIPLFIAIYPFCCITQKICDINTNVHMWIAKVDNEQITQEFQLFANEIQNKKVRFTAHNFFKLEASTLTAIIGSTFSYLVVLVQFHFLFREKPLKQLFGGASSYGNWSFLGYNGSELYNYPPNPINLTPFQFCN